MGPWVQMVSQSRRGGGGAAGAQGSCQRNSRHTHTHTQHTRCVGGSSGKLFSSRSCITKRMKCASQPSPQPWAVVTHCVCLHVCVRLDLHLSATQYLCATQCSLSQERPPHATVLFWSCRNGMGLPGLCACSVHTSSRRRGNAALDMTPTHQALTCPWPCS